jgi:hypothetical protein
VDRLGNVIKSNLVFGVGAIPKRGDSKRSAG